MKTVNYGIFCEDIVQKIFIEALLAQLPAYLGRKTEIEFLLNQNPYGKFIKNSNTKREIDNNFQSVAIVNFRDYQTDLFFVGRDLDHFEENNFRAKKEEMLQKLDTKIHEKTIIFIPVQCIEYWLWYIKLHIENPQITKKESLEKQRRDEAKKTIYGKSDARNPKQLAIIEDTKILKNIDIAWLCRCSYSFNALLEDVKKFVTAFLT